MADIAINPVTRRVQFTGNTGTGPFAFTFNILADEDIAVYKNTTLLTLTTDYTVTTNANGTGSITLDSGQALISSDVLTIIGGRDLSRTTDFVTAGDLLASSLNEQLDSLVIMTQQLDEKVGRTIKTNPGDVYTDLELPTKDNRKGTVLGFNATSGDPEVGPTIADVSSLASITADIATLADIEDGTDATDAIQTVAGISSNVTTVAGISSNVTTVAGNTSNINAVAADATDIGTVAGSISNVNTVAGIDSNITTVAGNTTNINTVAGNNSNITTVAGVSANVTTVAGISSDVTTVAGISSDVTTVAADGTDIGTVAASIADVNTVASNIATISAKVSKSGDTMTGDLTIQGNLTVSGTTITVDSATAQTIDLGDGDKMRFGDSNDAYIEWNTAGYFDVRSTGRFDIKSEGNDLRLVSNTNVGIQVDHTGGTPSVQLYNSGVQRLATTSTGIDVTGTVTADGLTVDANVTTGADFYTDANTNLYLTNSGTGNIGVFKIANETSRIVYGQNTTSDKLIFSSRHSAADSSQHVVIDNDGNVGIGTSSSASGGGIKLNLNGSSGGGIQFTNNNNGGGAIIPLNAGGQTFYTFTGAVGSETYTERMRIDSSGNVGVTGGAKVYFGSTTDSSSHYIKYNSSANGLEMHSYGSTIFTNYTGTERIRIDSSGNLLIGTSASVSNNRLVIDQASGDGQNSGFYMQRNGGAGTSFKIDIDSSDVVNLRRSATTALAIDSSGNVGIGTSSPSSFNSAANNLVVGSGASGDDTGITIYTNSNSSAHLLFADGTSGNASYAAYIRYNHPSDFMAFHNNGGNERMRIDSSGNLLVGKTSSSSSIDGTTIFSTGFLATTVTQGTAGSGAVAQFRRSSTDGDIVTFLKDSTTVGSIGTEGGDLTVGTGDVGLKFNDAVGLISPWDMTANAPEDNTIDLGYNNGRFKDLYLSGGVYLGGTGSANKLDDYEEGDFTANYSATGLTVTHDITTGKYTKVGNLVTFYILLGTDAVSGVGAVQLSITGLPFAPAAAGLGSGGAGLAYGFAANENNLKWTISSGGTLNLWDGDSNTAGVFPSNKLATGTNANRLNIIGHYYAA